MEKQVKIIVEKHSDGYVAYPLGLKGVVVSEGDYTRKQSASVNYGSERKTYKQVEAAS